MSLQPAFQGEVMLAGWSETHNGGAKVTFWLQDEAALSAFKAMTVAKGKTAGQRLALVAVEIGDDEQPKTANPVLQQDQELKGGPLSMWAALRGEDPEFQEWIGLTSPKQIREAILQTCGISSRSELDHNPGAARIFNQRFRIPYLESRP